MLFVPGELTPDALFIEGTLYSQPGIPHSNSSGRFARLSDSISNMPIVDPVPYDSFAELIALLGLNQDMVTVLDKRLMARLNT
jgi:hypothetical protein